jgi:hypothetical protein
MQASIGMRFTYPTNRLIIKTEPVTLLEILDIGIIVATRCTARVYHDGEQFIHVRTLLHGMPSILFIFMMIWSTTHIYAFIIFLLNKIKAKIKILGTQILNATNINHNTQFLLRTIKEVIIYHYISDEI